MAEVLCPFEPPGHQSIFSEPPPIAHADPHSSDTSAAPRLPHHPGAHGRVATAVDLVVTVCEAGALDFIAGAYTTPAQILETARAVRERTARPFGVNLFAPQPVPKPPEDTGRTLKRIGLYHVELGLPPPELPAPAPDPLEEPLSAVLESGASVFSFTFGPLPEAAVAAIKTRGMFLRHGHQRGRSDRPGGLGRGRRRGPGRGSRCPPRNLRRRFRCRHGGNPGAGAPGGGRGPGAGGRLRWHHGRPGHRGGSRQVRSLPSSSRNSSKRSNAWRRHERRPH